MKPHVSPQVASAALRNAFPYLRLYQGKRFVIKAGGEAFVDADEAEALLEQVSILQRLGIQVVLVHGGGPQISELSRRLDLNSEFVGGRRVTSEAVLHVAVMALCGAINKKIVAQLRAFGSSAVGISGIDGSLVTAERRAPQQTEGGNVDYGYVGDIRCVDPTILETLLMDGRLPVISPVCANATGDLLNVNADVVASQLAIALGAEKLIFLTGAPGILRDVDDPASLVSYTDINGLRTLEEDAVLEGGMLPKVASLRMAVAGGVPRVHVVSHRIPDTLLVEVFTNEGSGTLVVPDTAKLTPQEIGS